MSKRGTHKDWFLAKVVVDEESGCHIWQGATDPSGYGRFVLHGVNMTAHRAAHILFIGPIPDGNVVDHVRARGCLYTNCVNPEHLEAVTQRENVLRGASASADTCRNGHPRTFENTYTGRGKRECQVCRRAGVARSTARRKLVRQVG